MTSAKRKILIESIGTSPAVLTNAVWALAHQERFLGTPPFGLPNRVQRDIYAESKGFSRRGRKGRRAHAAQSTCLRSLTR